MILRALEPEDLEALYELENEQDIWECGNTTVPISRYAIKQYIANNQNDIFVDGQVRFAIDVDGIMVGAVDLQNFQPQHLRAEVGIGILKSFRGMGMGQQALNLLQDYARKVLGLHQIYAIVSSKNVKAQGMFIKCGYVRTCVMKEWLLSPSGEIQDAYLYQLLISR